MNYPEPIGINPLYRPSSAQIRQILLNHKPRVIRRDEEYSFPEHKAGHGLLFNAIMELLSERNWQTAEELAKALKRDRAQLANNLYKYGRAGYLRWRPNEHLQREYSPA